MLFLIKIVSKKEKFRNRKNQTPFDYAIRERSLELIEIFISKGADINAQNINYQYIKTKFLIKRIKKI